MIEMKVVRELLKMKYDNTNEFIAATMLDEFELNSEHVLDEEFVQTLLQIGLEIYYDFDYSTGVGVGVVIGDWLEYDYEPDHIYSYEELKQQIERKYMYSEWR